MRRGVNSMVDFKTLSLVLFPHIGVIHVCKCCAIFTICNLSLCIDLYDGGKLEYLHLYVVRLCPIEPC